MTASSVLRLAFLGTVGVAVIAVPTLLNQSGGSASLGAGVSRFFWFGGAGGVLAGLVGRGWRVWMVFLATILGSAIVETFVVVHSAPLGEQLLGSFLVFGLVAVPASIGWGLTAAVAKVLGRRA